MRQGHENQHVTLCNTVEGTKLKNLRPFETREVFFKCQLHGKNEHSWNQHIIDLENFIN